jgi:hypothetical protein
MCTDGGISTYAQVFDASGYAWYGVFLSMVAEGQYAVYMGNYFSHTCSSWQDDVSCLQYTDCTVEGIPAGYPMNDPDYGGSAGVSIEQTVSSLIPGNIYVLEFWSGGEYDDGYENGLFAVDVGYGNIFLQDTMTDLGGTGIRYIIEFVANSSSHTIRFTNWGHSAGLHTEVVLDDIRLYRHGQLSKTVPDCITGVAEYEGTSAALQVDLYPNPAHSAFSIQFKGYRNAAEKKLEIFDLAGRCVYEKSIRNFAQSEIRNAFSPGVYFIKLSSNEWSETKKLIIE